MKVLSPRAVNPLSFSSIRLEQYRNGLQIGHGTGFLVAVEDEVTLVTNYHVVTARDPRAPASLLPGYPDSPDLLRFRAVQMRQPVAPVLEGEISLANGEWLEHPRRGEGVDLVALRVHFDEDVRVFPLPFERLGTRSEDLRVAAEVTIIGFPFSDLVDKFFPVWKHGTIATEPSIDRNDLPNFLVDALSKEGMSGSPVFVVDRDHRFAVSPEAGAVMSAHERGDANISEVIKVLADGGLGPARSFEQFVFAGVYSGRVGFPSVGDLALGITWKPEAVRELLEEGVRGVHPYPPG